MRRRATGLIAVTALLASGLPSAGLSSPLQPYQMVRSLQLVQDRIADGDHAALPMQRKLLELIDGRLRTASAADFEDRRNFDALLIYSMSGGNPETIEKVAAGLHLEEGERELSQGVISYLNGKPSEALRSLQSADPFTTSHGVGAFLALVKGSILMGDDPEKGIELLDRAKLLGPGTLVEEAALRRSLAGAVELGDAQRFLRASGQYVRRFLRSPYAGQFAEAFVDGIVALGDALDLDAVDPVIAEMTGEQQTTIYLRLARRAAIDGYPKLLDFASARVSQREAETPDEADPRAVLYGSIGSVTSENVAAVLETLSRIDAARLSASDRRLLEAARSIAAEVTARPEMAALNEVDDAPRAIEENRDADDAQPANETGREMSGEEPEADEPEAGEPMKDEPEMAEAVVDPTAAETLPEAVEALPEAGETSAGDLVEDVRKRLSAVDALLEETSQ